ncbi:hypothetical protein [Nocardioides sp. URHA0020]|uniref:hypothetical protein n=1 Tax=Nocardioides sp. URHA0020 TaxID=1380392 RepID=UPI00048EF643|nr:hypothetical protein [Nocardioides sp. URHA0020]
MTTLDDRLPGRLSDLADHAPAGGPVAGLWAAGVRRRRARRTAALAGVVGVLVLVAGLTAVVHRPPDAAPAPAKVPVDQLHLPRTAYPPSPWAHGTDEVGAPGPLAFVSGAERRSTDGLTGSQETFEPFGVSAVDGSAVFLDLSGTTLEGVGGHALTLSPDGTKVGYTRYTSGHRVLGFAVYDTMTGATRMLTDPARPVIGAADLVDLRFSGDSRYLETAYARDGSADTGHASLVIWDVRTGALTVAEPPGHHWLPNLGSAPSGIVWSRGRKTSTYDPASGRTTSVEGDPGVVEASYGPDDEAFAAITKGETAQDPWRLLVGPGSDDLAGVSLDIDADQLLGWRDATHVVVRQLPTGEAAEVDLVSGTSSSLGLDVAGRQMELPSYAADLWANPLVDGSPAAHAGDPRLPWWLAGGAACLALVGAWLVRRRRVRV